MSETLPIRVLYETRAIIANGWCQCVLHHEDGKRHCTLGALQIALHKVIGRKNSAVKLAVYWRLIGLLGDLLGGDPLRDVYPGFIATWNDAEGRTRSEVLTLLERAIVKLRAGELYSASPAVLEGVTA